MNPNNSNAPGNADAAKNPEGNNVDRIRDILFGGQMRDYETKFSRFEERLAKETAELREDHKRRLASLEAFAKSEFEALSDQLRTEKEERSQALKALGGELKEHIKNWEKRCQQFETQNDKAHREIREQILSEANRLAEEIATKVKELASALDREGKRLSNVLVNRQALSESLAQLALRLQDDPAEPRAK